MSGPPADATVDPVVRKASGGRKAPRADRVCRWLVVHIPDDDDPRVLTCATFEDLAELMRGFVGLDGFVYAFYGVQVGVTDGDAKWLLHPTDGTALPLFQTGRSEEILTSGYFGKAVDYEIDPAMLEQAATNSAEPDSRTDGSSDVEDENSEDVPGDFPSW